MSNSSHRAGINTANLVNRHLKINADTSCEIVRLLDEINHSNGVDSVSFDKRKSLLNIAYDASHCDIDTIEAIVKTHGIKISNDWWTRLKEGHYRFVDQNVKDNANHIPHCCNKMPPGKNR